MSLRVFRGPTGILLLVLLSIIIVTCVIGLLLHIKRKRRRRANKLLLHKYSILGDHRDDVVMATKRNPVQPPSINQPIRVRLVPSKPPPLKKQKIVYEEAAEAECADRSCDANKSDQSLNQCKEKFLELFKKPPRLTSNHVKSFEYKRKSKPDIVELADIRRSLLKRMRRHDSVLLEGLGTVIYSLQYSNEILTVNLLSGRDIHSPDTSETIRFPAVRIQIEGVTETEVTSNPDDAPHPLYDQEFYFSIGKRMLKDTTLRFTVVDLVYSREVRVVGFLLVNLLQHEPSLFQDDVTPSLSGGIVMASNQCIGTSPGEIFVSLLYNCNTDKINVNVRRFRNITLNNDDKEVYMKVSLLLDNKVIQSKRTEFYDAASNISTQMNFDFNALSEDLDKTTNSHKKGNYKNAKVGSENSSMSSSVDITVSDALTNHMGVLLSVRATTTADNKRVIGRIYLGRTNVPNTDQQFHWVQMLKHFDHHVTQWHSLKLDRI